ncbi:sensor histidine kinase [Paucibacter sp. M5-1]|uniref:sensor histidine kinase n=1 Tax=Paucibacter sp. M5-1 TaxID=3015998 RepID=UPI003F7FA7F1
MPVSLIGSLLRSCLLLVVLLALPAAAQSLQIRELAVLADPLGRETLASISAPARQRDFRPVAGGFAAGYTRQVHWLRFRVDMPSAGGEVWLEVQPPYLDDLRLYAPERAGAALQEQRAGDQQRSAGRRELASTGYVFRLSAEAIAGRTLWLRLETSSSSLLLLAARTPAEFAAANGLRLGAFGLYYGLLLSLCAFCFWQGVWRHDLLHRAYLVSLLSLLLLMSCINGLHGLWLPEAWAGLADQATSYATLLSGLAANWFYRHALELRREGPGRWIWWLNRLALYAYGLGLLAPALGLYTEVAGALFQLTLLTTLVGFGRSLWLWRAGRPGSRMLALAHLISLSGVFTIVLLLLGVAPGQLWLLYSSQIGSLLTMAAFGIVVLLRRQGLEAAHREASERAEQALRQHAHERAARREQSRFIAMLSHEIRTPLSMIAGAAQALQKLVPSASEEVERRHRRIRRGVARIEQLLQQLLDQDRLDDEQFGLQRSRFDAAALCTELAEASEDQARLRLDLPAAAPRLHADRTLLATALGNLLGNALKYSPAEVGLSLRSDGRRVEFAVSDRGQGIAPELAARLFERYTRGPAVGGVAGSGLGLYLVRRIAGLHGGQVRLSARPGGGSVFLLSLPLEGEP